jgi:hypothetical protein
MTDRLMHEIDAPDPATRRAAALLRSVHLPEPSLSRRARVRSGLEVHESRRRLVVRRLVPVLAAATFLFGGAAAAAWMVSDGSRFHPRAPIETSPMLRDRIHRALDVDEARETAEPVPSTESKAAIAAPLKASPAIDVRATRSSAAINSPATRARSEPVRTDPIVATPPIDPASSVALSPIERVRLPDGAELVMRAVDRLRAAHDPNGALQLLDRYRTEHPRGMLVEEALGLSIEAAAALGDARAVDYAESYLDGYPEGRFVEAARRARVRFSR